MLEVSVGSLKPFKIDIAYRAISEFLHDVSLSTEGLQVESGVDEQPLSLDSTIEGAMNRSYNALLANTSSSFGIGLEGGVYLQGNQMFVVDVAAISVATDPIQTFVGESCHYNLPDEVAQLVLAGKTLSEAMFIYLGQEVPLDTIKHLGAIYFLSSGRLNRDLANKKALERALVKMHSFLSA